MISTLFMGRKILGAEALKYILKKKEYNIKAILEENTKDFEPVFDIARTNKIPIISTEIAAELANKNEFDLGLSLLYSKKLKKSLILQNSTYGCINFHPAILPDYKGCAGYNLAILNELDLWGVSSHYVDKSIDTGDIIFVSKFPIDNNETAFSLEKKSMKKLLEEFIKVIDDIPNLENGRFKTSKNIGGKYYSREFMERLKEILPGEDPELKAKAFFFPPYLGAYKVINQKKIEILPKQVIDFAKENYYKN